MPNATNETKHAYIQLNKKKKKQKSERKNNDKKNSTSLGQFFFFFFIPVEVLTMQNTRINRRDWETPRIVQKWNAL